MGSWYDWNWNKRRGVVLNERNCGAQFPHVVKSGETIVEQSWNNRATEGRTEFLSKTQRLAVAADAVWLNVFAISDAGRAEWHAGGLSQ